MAKSFEELDYQKTPWGEVILQRRTAFECDGQEVFEVKLNGEYLMSSLFVEGEVALTNLGLDTLSGDSWQVVVGGLGLGYTAEAALKYNEVSKLTIVEANRPVIDWHERELVPNGALFNSDERCEYLFDDFFKLARTTGFNPESPNYQYDAILLDIDHTPSALLNPSHGDFYSEEGMLKIKTFLKPGGVFALWSNDKPEDAFLTIMKAAFGEVEGHVVEFANPMQGGVSTNGVYVGRAK
jgi:spermidine synthase